MNKSKRKKVAGNGRKRNNSSNYTSAKEPAPSYEKNKSKELRFFSSFEEMNEYDQKEMASLTPVQRLQNITRMLMEMYREELKKSGSDLSIYFK